VQLLTRVKICGLCRPDDAARAAALGADFLGVILAPGYARTQIALTASAIWEQAPDVPRVGVFVNQPEKEVIGLARGLELSVLQLHGEESVSSVRRLRDAGDWRIWKAIRPRTGEEFEAVAARWGGEIDGLLVDGFSREASGGTGTRFPWLEVAGRSSAVLRATSFIVAGGLNPSNVADAIATLGPDTVDVSSGVESERGVKSGALLEAFFAAVRGAGRGAGQK